MTQMISATQISARRRLRLVTEQKPRLLLISDSAERLLRLRLLLSANNFEVTGVNPGDDLRKACRVQHCMAMVDVGPERIVEVLGVIRGSKAHAAIPLLVEVGRISADFGLAGVLPSYRAMPCCQNEMV